MSVFDAMKNNRGREDVGIYMAYATYEQRLLEAQQEERERIVAIVKQREEDRPWEDYSPQDVIDLVSGNVTERPQGLYLIHPNGALEELNRLAEDTGEFENFYNPLIREENE